MNQLNSTMVLDGFKRLVFPHYCVLCDRRILTDDNRFYCPECWALPTRVERPFCTQCGQPHTGQIGFGESANFVCAMCREKGPREYDRLFSACVYEGAAEDAVKRLKFQHKKQLAQLMAEELIAYAKREMNVDHYDLVEAVPLHPIRKRERGYNQSDLLVEGLLEEFPSLRRSNSLHRIRPTRVQSRISDPVLRKKNMVGAFAVEGSVDLACQSILLVDDVVTSGGTVSECAKALKRAGASEVDVLTFSVPILSVDMG